MAIIKNWHLGGIADSKRQGLKNSAYKMENCDVHSDPGVLKCYPELTDDGNSTLITGEVAAVVPASDNKTYFFGANGDVWVRTSSAVYSSLGSIPSGSAYGAIFDAKEFNGDIYYTMQQRVGKYTPGDSWNTSTVDGTQNNFKNISSDIFHPIKVIENDLYVGHANVVGKITPGESAGGAITDSITLDSIFTIESFGEMGRYLVIGARAAGASVGTFAGFSHIFRWDLVSNTWSTEVPVKELGISAFFDFDGALLFNAGRNGNIYSYDGENIQRYKRIPGISGSTASVQKNAITTYKGMLMIGVSENSGTPTSGVYSLGGYDKKYPNVFNLPISKSNIEVPCLARIDSDLIVCYKNVGSVSAVKKLGTDLETLTLESMLYDVKEPRSPIINYESYPSGTTIRLDVSVNGGAYTTLTLNQGVNNTLTSRQIVKARTLQFKLILTPNGTDTPIIESIEF